LVTSYTHGYAGGVDCKTSFDFNEWWIAQLEVRTMPSTLESWHGWTRYLPKVPTRRIEQDLNPWPSGPKASTQPMRHHTTHGSCFGSCF